MTFFLLLIPGWNPIAFRGAVPNERSHRLAPPQRPVEGVSGPLSTGFEPVHPFVLVLFQIISRTTYLGGGLVSFFSQHFSALGKN